MRVCQGCINEVRYVKEREENGKDASFTCTMDTIFEQGQQTFMHDDIGYHKVSKEKLIAYVVFLLCNSISFIN